MSDSSAGTRVSKLNSNGSEEEIWIALRTEVVSTYYSTDAKCPKIPGIKIDWKTLARTCAFYMLYPIVCERGRQSRCCVDKPIQYRIGIPIVLVIFFVGTPNFVLYLYIDHTHPPR
jgi:hypothetical protein